MYNRVILVGRLMGTPDIRRVPGGGRVATFPLAVDRPRHGVRDRDVDVIDVVAWPAVTDQIRHGLAPGHWVIVEGRVQVQTYTDPSCTRSWASEVVASCIVVLDAAAQTTDTPPPDDLLTTRGERCALAVPVQVPLLLWVIAVYYVAIDLPSAMPRAQGHDSGGGREGCV